MADKMQGKIETTSDAVPPLLVDDLLESSRVGTFVLDRNFSVVWINRSIEEYFGLQRASVIGRDKRRLIHEQIRHAVAEPEQFTDRVLATYDDNSYVERFECHILPGDGRDERWLEHWSQPIGLGAYAGGRIEHYTDITDRKQAQERVLFQASLLDAVEQAVVVTDLHGTIRYWNRHAEELYGWRADEVMGRHIVEVTPASEMMESASDVLELLKQGQTWSGNFALQRKDGTTFWGYVIDSPIYDQQGRLIGVVGVSMDVSARKQAEERLRARTQVLETLNRVNATLASELDLERLIQSITDAATHLTNAHFGAFFYNVQADSDESYTLYTISGVPRHRFEQFPMPRNTRLFGPTFRGESSMRIDDVLQDPRFGKNPPYNGMPAGHLPVRSYLSVPVVARSGEVMGGLFFGHPDVGVFTEQDEQVVSGMATQAAIGIENARLYHRLRESERRFRTTFENAAVGIAHVGMDGAWLRVNQRFCDILSYRRDELLQRSTQDLTHPDDLQINEVQQERLIQGKLSSYTVEQRYIRHSGEVVWVSVTKSLQRDAAGTPLYTISVIQDITARKEAEWAQGRLLQELEAERAALERRVEERTKQVRSLAADLALAEQEERERIAHLLHEHVQQVLYAVKMRAHLLELEMATQNREAIQRHLTEVKTLTDEAIKASRSLTVDLSPPILEDEGLFEALAWLSTQMKELYDLTISVEIEKGFHLRERSLTVLLFQMVRELLFNVVKHARTDEARVLLQRKDQQVTIRILDDGQGFDSARPEEGSRQTTGFGLRSICERLNFFGGTMHVNSAPNRGTEVVLSLPIAEP